MAQLSHFYFFKHIIYFYKSGYACTSYCVLSTWTTSTINSCSWPRQLLAAYIPPRRAFLSRPFLSRTLFSAIIRATRIYSTIETIFTFSSQLPSLSVCGASQSSTCARLSTPFPPALPSWPDLTALRTIRNATSGFNDINNNLNENNNDSIVTSNHRCCAERR